MHVSTQKAHGPAARFVQDRHFDTMAFKVLLVLFAAALNGLAWMFITALLCAAFGSAAGSTLPLTVGLSAAGLSAVALLAISTMRGRSFERALD